MSKALGIDLGTSNTVVAAVIDGEPRVLTDDGGAALQASVVSFPTLGGAIVGNDARERVAIDPGSTIRSSKRLMGRPIYSPEAQEMKSRSPYVIEEGPNRSAVFKIGERRFSPEEIAAQILTHMSGVADRRLGEQVRKAVITVPASFKEAQRSATLRAGTMAGLDVLRLLNEPTAAALAYGFDQNPARQLVAIYDLGGGTFDITILEQRGNIFEVRSTAGDTFLGGDDLDDRIANSMCDVVERETGFDPRNDLNFWQRLRVLAEQTKCALSVQQNVTVDIEAKLPGERTARSVPYSLDRRQFNEWAMEIIQRTLVTCDEALRLARIQSRDVDALVLVGGSTRIPILRDSVGQYFFQEPRTSIDPDQVVAIGAAIFAESLANPGYGTEVPDVPSWGDTAILRMPGAVQSGEYDAVKPLDSLDDDGATAAQSRDEMEAPDTEKMNALETANTMEERRLEAPVERTERRAPPQRQKPLLLDVTSHAIGVETLGGIFDIIIDRNARVPVSRTKLFTTTRRGQTVVRLRVYEGVERKARQNHRLGELVLTGLKPDERGATRIAVTLSLDTSGMLTVDARDDETGSHAEVDLEVAGLAP